jgi:hypothetical protein
MLILIPAPSARGGGDQQANLCSMSEPLLNDQNNQAKAIFDFFLSYPIDAGAFPLNLAATVTAQREDL